MADPFTPGQPGSLKTTEWTVVATRPRAGKQELVWSYIAPFTEENLQAKSDESVIIVMHRARGAKTELLARLATPSWRRLQAQLKESGW